MNSNFDRIRTRNPRENANWISLLTFFFALKIFRRFYGGDIKETDVYEVITSFRSEGLGNQLESVLAKERKNSKMTFIKALFKIFWKKLVFWALLVLFVDTAIMIIYPLILGKLVSFFSPGQTNITLDGALVYTSELVVIIVFYTFYIQAYVLYVVELGLKLKIACSSVIYRKCLKLNAASLQNSINGLVLTMVSKDINQIEYAVDVFVVMFSGVFQSVIMIYMMYNEIGIAALLGASMLLILLPLQEITKGKPIESLLTPTMLVVAQMKLQQEHSNRSIAKSSGVDESSIRKLGYGVTSLGRFKTTFTVEQEAILVDHLRFYGITRNTLRDLVYEFAVKNNIKNDFNKKTQMAGEDWTKAFLSRLNISLKVPQKTSVGRIMGFNKIQIERFFRI